jgi:hypothetical protein
LQLIIIIIIIIKKKHKFSDAGSERSTEMGRTRKAILKVWPRDFTQPRKE